MARRYTKAYEPVRQYCTPAGYRDTHFIYVFDATQLIDVSGVSSTNNKMNNAVLLAGNEDQFLLRGIDFAGFTQIGPIDKTEEPGGFWLKDANGRYRSSSPRPLVFWTTDASGMALSLVSLAPEIAYPFGSQIYFDLVGNLGLDYNGNSAAYSPTQSVRLGQILFRGVRRYRHPEPTNDWDRYKSGNWLVEPYSYIQTVAVDWTYYQGGVSTGGVAALQNYSVVVDSWDFELDEIRVSGNIADLGADGVIKDTAAMVLYDPAKVAMMNAPVSLQAINSANTQTTSTGASGGMAPVLGRGALTPPMIYPRGSEIYFQLQSLLSDLDPLSSPRDITFEFRGKRRSRLT